MNDKRLSRLAGHLCCSLFLLLGTATSLHALNQEKLAPCPTQFGITAADQFTSPCSVGPAPTPTPDLCATIYCPANTIPTPNNGGCECVPKCQRASIKCAAGWAPNFDTCGCDPLPSCYTAITFENSFPHIEAESSELTIVPSVPTPRLLDVCVDFDTGHLVPQGEDYLFDINTCYNKALIEEFSPAKDLLSAALCPDQPQVCPIDPSIKELELEVQHLTSALSEAQDTVGTQEGTISGLESTISSLSSDLESLKLENDRLHTLIDNFECPVVDPTPSPTKYPTPTATPDPLPNPIDPGAVCKYPAKSTKKLKSRRLKRKHRRYHRWCNSLVDEINLQQAQ